MERAGADALPIILLIHFLVGLAMAFQAAVQLKRFGVELLVADLIGISVTRELGPLMTAIVVCGRSGGVSLWDISSGLIKSVVFALAIALIACQQGLSRGRPVSEPLIKVVDLTIGWDGTVLQKGGAGPGLGRGARRAHPGSTETERSRQKLRAAGSIAAASLSCQAVCQAGAEAVYAAALPRSLR